MSDWWAAVRRPPAHRVRGQDSGDCQSLTRWALGISVVLLACFIALLTALPNGHDCSAENNASSYNDTYPLSPVQRTDDGGLLYRIGVVTDLDHGSKSQSAQNVWFSYFREGTLQLGADRRHVTLQWQPETREFKSTLSQGGRGMELSDLKAFDGHLLSVDDRTGVIYRMDADSGVAVPWVLLADGAGNQTKGLFDSLRDETNRILHYIF